MTKALRRILILVGCLLSGGYFLWQVFGKADEPKTVKPFPCLSQEDTATSPESHHSGAGTINTQDENEIQD